MFANQFAALESPSGARSLSIDVDDAPMVQSATSFQNIYNMYQPEMDSIMMSPNGTRRIELPAHLISPTSGGILVPNPSQYTVISTPASSGSNLAQYVSPMLSVPLNNDGPITCASPYGRLASPNSRTINAFSRSGSNSAFSRSGSWTNVDAMDGVLFAKFEDLRPSLVNVHNIQWQPVGAAKNKNNQNEEATQMKLQLPQPMMFGGGGRSDSFVNDNEYADDEFFNRKNAFHGFSRKDKHGWSAKNQRRILYTAEARKEQKRTQQLTNNGIMAGAGMSDALLAQPNRYDVPLELERPEKEWGDYGDEWDYEDWS